jgi:hypothetical protein
VADLNARASWQKGAEVGDDACDPKQALGGGKVRQR